MSTASILVFLPMHSRRGFQCIYQAVTDKADDKNAKLEQKTRLAEPSVEYGSPSLTPNPVEIPSAVGPHRYRSTSRRPNAEQSIPSFAGIHPANSRAVVDMSPAQPSFGTIQPVPPPSISGYNAFGNVPSASMPNSSPVNLPPLNPIYLDSGNPYSPLFPHNPNFQFNPPDIPPALQAYAATATGSMVLQAPPFNQGLSAILEQSASDRQPSYSDIGPSDTFNNFQSTSSRNNSTTTLYDRRMAKPSVDISTLFGGSSYHSRTSRDGSVSSSHILLPDQQQARSNGLATPMSMDEFGYSRQPVSAMTIVPNAYPASLPAIMTTGIDSGSFHGLPSGDSSAQQQEDGEDVLEIQTKDLSAYHKLRSSHSAKEFSGMAAIISSHLPHTRKEGQQRMIGFTREEWENGSGSDAHAIKDSLRKQAIDVFSTDDGLVFKRFIGVQELQAYFPSLEQRQQASRVPSHALPTGILILLLLIVSTLRE